jgi:hypothetical protein
MVSLARIGRAVFGGLLLASSALGVTTAATLAAGNHTMENIRGKWLGTLDQFSHDNEGSFPVTLTVEATSGDEFTGTMEWPTFDGRVTKVQGMFDGQLIKWSETAYLKGDDVVLYGLYVARFKADNEMSADWMDPSHTIHPKGPSFGVPCARFTLKKQ